VCIGDPVRLGKLAAIKILRDRAIRGHALEASEHPSRPWHFSLKACKDRVEHIMRAREGVLRNGSPEQDDTYAIVPSSGPDDPRNFYPA
jgi:hypothetical protein